MNLNFKDETQLERFLARLDDLTPGILGIFDLKLRKCTFIGGNVRLTLGYTPQEVYDMGESVVQFLMHPEDQARFELHLQQMQTIEEGVIAEFQHRMRDRAGAWHWFLSRDAIFDRDDSGQVNRIVSAAAPISTEQLALNSSARLAANIESSTDAIYSYNLAGRILSWNRSAAELYGYQAEEIIGKNITAIVPSDRVHELANILGDIGSGKSAMTLETKRLKRDGSCFAVSLIASPIRDSTNQIAAVSVAARDISDRKRMEAELRRSEELHRVSFELAPLGMAYLTPDGRFAKVNQSYCEITGYTKGELLTMNVRDLSHPDDRPSDSVLLESFLHGGSTEFVNEKRYVRKDGECRWVSVTARMILDDSGQPLHTVGVIQDITDKKIAEQRLRGSEEFSRTMFESSPDCMKILDADGTLLAMNNPGMCLLEIEDCSPLQGKPWWELWPLESRPLVQDAVARARQGQVSRFEAYCPTIKGTPKWWNVMVAPVRNYAGEIYRIISASRDITEHVETQRALQASEARLNLGVEVAGLTLAEVNYTIGTVHLTPASARMFGLGESAMTVPRELLHSTFHPDDRNELETNIAAALDPAGKGWFELDHRVSLSDGAVRWLRVRKQVTFEGLGSARRPVRSMLVAMDITSEKLLEMELRSNEQHFRQLADSMPQLVWSTLPDGFCDLHNQRWVEYTGLSLEESRGTGWTVVVHPEDLQVLNEKWMLSLQTAEGYEVESRYRRHDGEYRWFLIRAVPVTAAGGRIVRWFGTSTDIEENKRLEAALQLANDDWKHFVYSASHDLRSPLRTITVFSQLIQRMNGSNLDESAQKLLDGIEQTSKGMSELLSNLLAYAEASASVS